MSYKLCVNLISIIKIQKALKLVNKYWRSYFITRKLTFKLLAPPLAQSLRFYLLYYLKSEEIKIFWFELLENKSHPSVTVSENISIFWSSYCPSEMWCSFIITFSIINNLRPPQVISSGISFIFDFLKIMFRWSIRTFLWNVLRNFFENRFQTFICVFKSNMLSYFPYIYSGIPSGMMNF